jgi:DNA modification methylase
MNLHVVNVNELVIPERQRKEFAPEALVELASSISQNGLIHPIVVRRDGDKIVLVAGERRVKAMVYVWRFGEKVKCGEHVFEEGQIPALYLGELDPVDAFEIELEENIRRRDLTWQEKAVATSQLMELRRMQAERRGDKPPTVGTITEEIHGTADPNLKDDVRKELILSRFLDDPDVAKAKTRDDAFKIVKRKESLSKSALLAQEVGKVFSKSEHKAVNGDCITWLAECPPEVYDVVLTDPPYGINADNFGDSNNRVYHGEGHGYKDTYENWRNLMTNLPTLLMRVTKPQAHLYVFCDICRFEEMKQLFISAQWNVFRTPLIWHNLTGLRLPWVQTGPQRKYEAIMYAEKGGKPVNYLAGDVITCAPDKNLNHLAQKPVEIYQELLKRSCKPGDRVLDPFAGSGTIFPAAHALKLRATGIEIDPSCYGIALKRIEELQ